MAYLRGKRGHVILVLFTWIVTASGFIDQEIECPDKLHYGISSREYWHPIGEPYRAWKSLPWRYFVIKPSNIEGGGLGVFATTFIPKNTWLGEYEGDILPAHLADGNLLPYAWNSYTDDEVYHYIDGSDPDRSNWLRFINSPNRHRDENVSSHQCYGKVFYRTMKDLYPGQELYVSYGDYYAKEIGIFDDYYNE